jgi:HK97 gp10 family phage protein
VTGFFELKPLGIPEAKGFISQIQRELKQDLRGRLRQAATLVAEEMRRDTHSKRVAAAIGFDIEVESLFEFRASIGPTRKRAWFAHFLEFGTEHSRAFPFAAPALETTEDEVVELVGIPPSLR